MIRQAIVVIFCMAGAGALAMSFDTDPTTRPHGVDLRDSFEALKLPPRQQGKRGACQVFAFLGPAEYGLARAGHSVDLSAQYLMWAANRANHVERTGGFNPDLLLRGLQEFGVCEEGRMPYVPREEPIGDAPEAAVREAKSRLRCTFTTIKHWTRPIGFDEQDIDELINRLDHQTPVTTTFCWPFGLNDSQIVDSDNFLIDRNIDRHDKSGHGVVLVGYWLDARIAGGGYFIFRNSWGTAFADRGYAKIDFLMAGKYGIDAYIMTFN